MGVGVHCLCPTHPWLSRSSLPFLWGWGFIVYAPPTPGELKVHCFVCGGGCSLLWPLHCGHFIPTPPPPPPHEHFNSPLPLRTFYCFTSPHGQFINSPPHPWILFITSHLPSPIVILFGEGHSVENLIIHSCDNGASRPCEHRLLGVLVSLPFAGVEFIW